MLCAWKEGFVKIKIHFISCMHNKAYWILKGTNYKFNSVFKKFQPPEELIVIVGLNYNNFPTQHKQNTFLHLQGQLPFLWKSIIFSLIVLSSQESLLVIRTCLILPLNITNIDKSPNCIFLSFSSKILSPEFIRCHDKDYGGVHSQGGEQLRLCDERYDHKWANKS